MFRYIRDGKAKLKTATTCCELNNLERTNANNYVLVVMKGMLMPRCTTLCAYNQYSKLQISCRQCAWRECGSVRIYGFVCFQLAKGINIGFFILYPFLTIFSWFFAMKYGGCSERGHKRSSVFFIAMVNLLCVRSRGVVGCYDEWESLASYM